MVMCCPGWGVYPSELYMWLCVVQLGACTPVSCTCGYVLSRLGRVPQSVVHVVMCCPGWGVYASELYMWLCVVQVGACTPVSCTCGYVLSRLGRVPQ